MRPLPVAMAAIIAHASLAGAPGPQAVYRAQTDVVVIDVAVTDGRKPVSRLGKDDFELRDNGVLQQILDFNRVTLPLDMTVTIDISGSMTPADRTVVERAIARVNGALGPADRAAMVAFASRVTERVPLQHPPIPIDVSGLGPGTAVLDALLLSLVTPTVADRRQFVLFMTDGQDNASYFDAHTVTETAKHANATIAIVLVPNRAPRAVRDVFRSVTNATGGEIIELEKGDDLSQAFLTALENFRTSYVLRYSPTGVPSEGWHDVDVKVKSRKYTVRARRGYWKSGAFQASGSRSNGTRNLNHGTSEPEP